MRTEDGGASRTAHSFLLSNDEGFRAQSIHWARRTRLWRGGDLENWEL